MARFAAGTCIAWTAAKMTSHVILEKIVVILQKYFFPPKKELFLDNGYGSWHSPRMGADRLPPSPDERPMLNSVLPVSTRQRSRMMVAAEVISLEYMLLVLAGCWWSSGVYKPRVYSGVATTLDWTGQRERERERSSLAFLTLHWRYRPAPPTDTARYLGSSLGWNIDN